MTPPLQSAPIEALCWRANGAAGVRRHTLLTEAGRYYRHQPCLVDATELEPWGAQYHPLGDNSRQLTPQVVCYELQDARVTSQGCVITRDGHVVRESLGNLLQIEGLRVKGLRPLDERGEQFAQDLQPSRHVPGRSLLLKRAWWRNFGHWMLEAAAPLALMRERGALSPDFRLVTGRFEEPAMITIVRATIDALWPWPEPAIEQHDDDEMVTFERLYYTTPVHGYLCQDPAAVRALRSFMVPPPGPAGPRGIFIDRQTRLRRLVNQDEVRATCMAFGCHPVKPADYPLLEQVRLFREAEVIVGVKGSDFVNAMFCAPWARLVVLTPGDFPDPMVWDLSAHGPLNYFELYGGVTERVDVNGRNAFAISCEKLLAVMSLACAQPGPGSPLNRRRYSMQQWTDVGYAPWLDSWAVS